MPKLKKKNFSGYACRSHWMRAAFLFPAAQFAAPLLPAGPSHGTRRHGFGRRGRCAFLTDAREQARLTLGGRAPLAAAQGKPLGADSVAAPAFPLPFVRREGVRGWVRPSGTGPSAAAAVLLPLS
ncbi:hypothetical protein HSX37_16530|uniref:hypothetical protein n=1 Tax=Dendrosporobacter quercicolus TaxID=146817 RepID=UPI000B86335C|nr:hypothetical protein [Dendrosporobacter quercicolus]NSL49643.1 hypothetical protein [Dendrosporobacter quercicolus DSM 1736]